jgi:hypothetical protein
MQQERYLMKMRFLKASPFVGPETDPVTMFSSAVKLVARHQLRASQPPPVFQDVFRSPIERPRQHQADQITPSPHHIPGLARSVSVRPLTNLIHEGATLEELAVIGDAQGDRKLTAWKAE